MPSDSTILHLDPDEGRIVTARTTDERAHPASRIVALVGGGAFLAFGVWAMASPRSFFEQLATFEPYNQHLLQDIGAFQVGLGAVLLIAVISGRDAITVALLGAGIGSAAHTVSHVLGRDLGGTPAVDIPVQGALAAVLLIAGWARARAVPRTSTTA